MRVSSVLTVVGCAGACGGGKTLIDTPPKADATQDCTGLYCPQPVIRTATRAKEMQPGQVLEVLATDPGFQIDLPAWCQSQRHEFLGIQRDNGVFVGYVLLKARSYD